MKAGIHPGSRRGRTPPPHPAWQAPEVGKARPPVMPAQAGIHAGGGGWCAGAGLGAGFRGGGAGPAWQSLEVRARAGRGPGRAPGSRRPRRRRVDPGSRRGRPCRSEQRLGCLAGTGPNRSRGVHLRRECAGTCDEGRELEPGRRPPAFTRGAMAICAGSPSPDPRTASPPLGPRVPPHRVSAPPARSPAPPTPPAPWHSRCSSPGAANRGPR